MTTHKSNKHWAFKFKSEVLDIWNNAVAYFNNVAKIVNHYPDEAEFDLDTKTRRSALCIPDYIAKGTNSKSSNDFFQSLDEAIESVEVTVSKLHIAKEKKYLRTDLYNEAFDEGKLLVKKMKNFSLEAFMSNLN